MYKKLYRVRLDAAAQALHKLVEGDRIVDGYLAFCGKIQNYGLAEANKKAFNFDGKKEPYNNPLLDVITNVTMVQLAESALLEGTLKLLQDREAFTDADTEHGERIFHGDVFEAIASDQQALGQTGSILFMANEEVLQQLEDLAEFISADYVQLVKP